MRFSRAWADLKVAIEAVRPVHLAWLLGLAMMALSVPLEKFPSTVDAGLRFVDGDDALRLIQVRQFMETKQWFNPVIANFGDGSGLQSHWSRLLDLPIALAIAALNTVMSRAAAEWVTTLFWPKLILILFMAAYAHRALVEAGRRAAVLAVLFCWLSFYCLTQFQMGRIDHHNIQIACATLAILMASSASATPRQTLAAGLLAGFGLAIGYEALPAIITLAGMLAMIAVWQDDWRAKAQAFSCGLAITLSTTLAVTVKPGDWLNVPCDALGLNIVAGAIAGCLTVMISAIAKRPLARLGVLIIGGLMAAFLAYSLAPVCIGGAFARFDQGMSPLWLDHMTEAQSLVTRWQSFPAFTLAAGISLAVILAAQIALWFHNRTAENLIRLVLLAILTILGARYQKIIPYAQFVGFFCLARAVASVPSTAKHITPTIAIAAAIAWATPTMLIAQIILVAPSLKVQAKAGNKTDTDRNGPECTDEAAFGPLKLRSPARILTQQDLGPYLALMPQHQILTGNYHRLDKEIMRAASILNGPLGSAHQQLLEWRVDLVVICKGEGFYKNASPEGSLADRLMRSDAPDWLKPIDFGMTSPIAAFEVIKR